MTLSERERILRKLLKKLENNYKEGLREEKVKEICGDYFNQFNHDYLSNDTEERYFRRELEDTENNLKTHIYHIESKGSDKLKELNKEIWHNKKSVRIISLLIITYLILGLFNVLPKEVSIFGLLTYEIPQKENRPIYPTQQDTEEQIDAKDLLTIKDLKSTKNIYNSREKTRVDFSINSIKPDLQVPYIINVEFFNNTAKYFNYSFTNVTIQPYYVFYDSNSNIGKNTVQVYLEWIYDNYTYSDGKSTTFEVY